MATDPLDTLPLDVGDDSPLIKVLRQLVQAVRHEVRTRSWILLSFLVAILGVVALSYNRGTGSIEERRLEDARQVCAIDLSAYYQAAQGRVVLLNSQRQFAVTVNERIDRELATTTPTPLRRAELERNRMAEPNIQQVLDALSRLGAATDRIDDVGSVCGSDAAPDPTPRTAPNDV